MSERASKIGLAAFLLALFAYNACKFNGYLPLVFPDEATYIASTVNQPLSESVIPNYCYYGVYSVVSRFGDGYLDAARIMNGFFYALAGPFLFMIARMGCGPGLSLLIAASSLLLPYSWYTAFFMPESLSFTCFWIWAWFLLRYRRRDPLRYGFLAGLGIGLASLVKVHWVFLLPCYGIFILLSEPRAWRTRSGWTRIAAAVPAFFLAKFGLSLLLAGTKGLTFFGHDYNVLAETGLRNATLGNVLTLTLTNLGGHIPVLLFFFGLVLILAIAVFPSAMREVDAPALAERNLIALLFATLPVLLLITAGFTAGNSLFLLDNASKEVAVIQTRYYSFLYPAFLVLAGYLLRRGDALPRPWGGRWLFGGLATFIFLAFATNFWHYHYFQPLCPEISVFFTGGPSLASFLVTAAVITPCLLAMTSLRKALRTFICVVMPLLAVYFTIALPVSYHRYLERYDPAVATGRYLKEVLGEEIDALTILDTSEHMGSKVRFFTDSRHIPLHKRLAPHQEIDLGRMAPDSQWILALGNTAISSRSTRFTIQLAPPIYNFTLFRVADFSYSVDLTEEKPAWPIRSVRRENGGVTVEYAIPLPEVMRVEVELPGGMDRREYALDLDGLPRPARIDAGSARTITVKNPGKTLRLRPAATDGGAALPEKIAVTVRSELPVYAAWEDHQVTLPIDYRPTLPR